MDAKQFATWMTSRDTGSSSIAIACAALGAPAPEARGWSYPLDSADFGRCARLLAKHPEIRVPAFARLAAEGGRIWAALIERWDVILAAMEDEVGIDWSKGESAPNTHDLIRSIIDRARGTEDAA